MFSWRVYVWTRSKVHTPHEYRWIEDLWRKVKLAIKTTGVLIIHSWQYTKYRHYFLPFRVFTATIRFFLTWPLPYWVKWPLYTIPNSPTERNDLVCLLSKQVTIYFRISYHLSCVYLLGWLYRGRSILDSSPWPMDSRSSNWSWVMSMCPESWRM